MLRAGGLFAWLISHQPAVLFSHNKPAISNQPAVLFSQNKPAPAISYQPTEQAEDLLSLFLAPAYLLYMYMYIYTTYYTWSGQVGKIFVLCAKRRRRSWRRLQLIEDGADEAADRASNMPCR
jgi:hypothetical protein